MPYECDSDGQWWYVARNYRSRAYPQTCETCGKAFYARKSDRTRFCSNACGLRGPNHPHWTGGRYFRKGYVFVIPPWDDRIGVAMRDNRGYVAEHRLVMARALGRPLDRREHVHHINGDRADNRLENLELLHLPHGPGARLRCARCGHFDLRAVPLRTTDAPSP